MNAIGQTLKRQAGDGPELVRVAAVDGRNWILEPLGDFGPCFALTAAELQANYGGDADDPPVIDESVLWQQMADRPAASPEPAPEPLLTPEQKLALEARATN